MRLSLPMRSQPVVRVTGKSVLKNVPEAHVADNDDLYPWCCVHVVQLPSATCIDDWQVVQGVAITRGLPDSPANSHLHRALSLYQSRSVGVPGVPAHLDVP